MRIRAILFLVFSLTSSILWSQSLTQGFKYQAIARDASGNELTNKNITVQLSVIQGEAVGPVVWQETHSPTTNEYGLYDLIVGQGGSTGSGSAPYFSDVDWSGNHFLKIEVDFGTGLLNMGTIQLLPVPYALFAEKSQTKFSDGEFAIINTTDMADNPIGAPSGFATGAPGNVDVGTHDYKITYITDSGETAPGELSGSVVLSAPGQVMLTNIPVSAESSVRKRGIYRRFNGAGDYKFAGVVDNNSAEIFTDNASNADLGKNVPGVNVTEVSARFDFSELTDNRNFVLPDKSGLLFIGPIIENVYSGSEINVQTLSTNSADSSDYIFPEIKVNRLFGAKFLKITINGSYRNIVFNYQDYAYLYFNIKTRAAVSGEFTDSFPESIISYEKIVNGHGEEDCHDSREPINFVWIHELSENEKSEGLFLELITIINSKMLSSYTNFQTIIEIY